MDIHVVSAIIRLILNLVMPQKAGSALQTATKIVQMLYTTRWSWKTTLICGEHWSHPKAGLFKTRHMNKGGNFLKKLWCCAVGRV